MWRLKFLSALMMRKVEEESSPVEISSKNMTWYSPTASSAALARGGGGGMSREPGAGHVWR